MAFAQNYTDLQNTVANWLNRTDLLATQPNLTTSVIQDAIALVESDLQIQLRRFTVRNTSFSVTGESVALPSDCVELRSINLVTGDPSNDTALAILTFSNLADLRAYYSDVPNRPRFAAIITGNIVFCPPPDTTYVADITYYQAIPALAAVGTNTVLTTYPKIYLYGALAQVESLLEHDDRANSWQAKYQAEIDKVHNQAQDEEFGASLRPVRLPFAGFGPFLYPYP